MCWECKLKAAIEREKMELTFTKELLRFLSSFKKETEEETLYFRVGLLEGAFWLALEDKDNIGKADELAEYYENDTVDLYIYCDCEDLEILRGTEVAYEMHGLSRRVCFKDPRFDNVYFSGEMHPALED